MKHMKHIQNTAVLAAALYGLHKQYEQARKTESYHDWAQFWLGAATVVLSTVKAAGF
jgi:hypothetical protein